MLCLIMAGGRGSRLGYVSKPMIDFCGKPLIEWVLENAQEVCDFILVAISKYTREISRICTSESRVECIETSGLGYVEDLSLLLSALRKPLLVLPSDTPLISKDILKEFLNSALSTNADIVNMVRKLDKERILLGIALFKKESGRWTDIAFEDPKLIDIDTVKDLIKLRRWCSEYAYSWR